MIEFNVRPTELSYGAISSGLVAELGRLLDAVAKKFEMHQSARRVFVLDPYADMRWSTDDTWRKLLAAVVISSAIHEIWLSMHAMITELRCGWVQQQLWPVLGEQHMELCAPPSGEA